MKNILAGSVLVASMAFPSTTDGKVPSSIPGNPPILTAEAQGESCGIPNSEHRRIASQLVASVLQIAKEMTGLQPGSCSIYLTGASIQVRCTQLLYGEILAKTFENAGGELPQEIQAIHLVTNAEGKYSMNITCNDTVIK